MRPVDHIGSTFLVPVQEVQHSTHRARVSMLHIRWHVFTMNPKLTASYLQLLVLCVLWLEFCREESSLDELYPSLCDALHKMCSTWDISENVCIPSKK